MQLNVFVLGFVLIVGLGMMVGTFFLFEESGAPISTTYAQQMEDWETYENENCGISIDHPYEDDFISDNGQKFRIISITEPEAPVAISLIIQIICSNQVNTITNETMGELKSKYMNEPGDFVEEDILFDKWTIDDEKTGSVVIGHEPFRNTQSFDQIILTNYDDRSYEIMLGLSSILDWDNELYQNLQDQAINSIQFID